MNTTIFREEAKGLVGPDLFSTRTTYAQTNIQLFNQLKLSQANFLLQSGVPKTTHFC